jgi:hypothetical protein
MAGCASTMFYEIARERCETDGRRSWTTIYRSRDGRRINSEGFFQFSATVLDETDFHNGRPDRQLRFVVFKRNNKARNQLVCFAQVSLEEMVTIALGAPACPSNRKTGMSVLATNKPRLGHVPLVFPKGVGGKMEWVERGTMRVVSLLRDPARNDTVVIDLRADISLPRAYISSDDVRRKLSTSVSRMLRLAVSLS